MGSSSKISEAWAINMTNIISILIQVIVINPELNFAILKNRDSSKE